jgi:predicted nucleic acid-binding protein
VDATVLIASLFDEPASAEVRAFMTALRSADELVAAQVLLPECAAVLRRKVAEGLTSGAEALERLDELLELPIDIETSRDQFRLAFEWALATNRIKMHDLQYIAVARLRNASMVTIDGGMHQAAVEHGVPARLLR